MSIEERIKKLGEALRKEMPTAEQAVERFRTANPEHKPK